MVIALGHRHRLMAGEVVDLLYGDAEVEDSCDEEMVGVAVWSGLSGQEAGDLLRIILEFQSIPAPVIRR